MSSSDSGDILRQRLTPSADAFANSVGDETVLLQIKQGTYYGLDPIGTRVWAGLTEGRLAIDVCREIAEEFGVAQEIVEQDARTFLEELKANEIIVAE